MAALSFILLIAQAPEKVVDEADRKETEEARMVEEAVLQAENKENSSSSSSSSSSGSSSASSSSSSSLEKDRDNGPPSNPDDVNPPHSGNGMEA